MADESTMMWCVGLLVVFLLFGGCCWCMCQREESAPRAVGLRQRGVRRAKLMANPFAKQEADEKEEPAKKPEGFCYAERPVMPNCSKATMNGRMNLKGAQYAHIAGGAALRHQVIESSADLESARQLNELLRGGEVGARVGMDEMKLAGAVLRSKEGADELTHALEYAGGDPGARTVAMDKAMAAAVQDEE